GDGVLRLPPQHLPRLVAAGVRAGHVAGAAPGLPLPQRLPDDLFERAHHLPYRGPGPGPEVDHLVAGAVRRHDLVELAQPGHVGDGEDRKSTRLNSSHVKISYAVFCLTKKKCTAPQPANEAESMRAPP